MRMPTLLVMGAAAAALAVAGCGGGGGSTSTSASSTPASTPAPAASTPNTAASGGASSASGLKISADTSGALKFNTTSLSAKAGKVTITMANPSQVPHGVAIKGNGVNTVGKIVGSGGDSTVTADLKPGTYTFYCPVPGHEQAGMKGTLTVK